MSVPKGRTIADLTETAPMPIQITIAHAQRDTKLWPMKWLVKVSFYFLWYRGGYPYSFWVYLQQMLNLNQHLRQQKQNTDVNLKGYIKFVKLAKSKPASACLSNFGQSKCH